VASPSPEVPEVDHGSDLQTEPVIHPGTATPSLDLVTHELVIGDGAVATATDTVTIRYTGALYSDGKVFDNSPWSRQKPAVFPLNQVVPGFSQGIAGMKAGGRRVLVIPPALGYGAQTNGPIPGNSTLVFVVDLLAVT
jgi:peptidylprolyl isomerase